MPAPRPCAPSMHKDTKKFVKAAVARGWQLIAGTKHPALLHPSGRKVVMASTPSCPRSVQNFMKDVERVEREYAAGRDFCSPDQCVCRVVGDDPAGCSMGVARLAP